MAEAAETLSHPAELPDYPKPRTCPYHPSGDYGRPVVRARLYNGRPAWLVTGHEEARKVLLDGCGHMSLMERPALVADAVVKLVDSP